MADRQQDLPEEERDSAARRPVTAAARRARHSMTAGSVGPGGRGVTVVERNIAKPGSTAKKGKATPSRSRQEKRPSIFARLARFFREVVDELRKVIWPTRKQEITYTVVVLIFVAFVVAFVAALDLLFGKGVFWLFA